MLAIQLLEDYLGHCRGCPRCAPATEHCVGEETHRRAQSSLCPQGLRTWEDFLRSDAGRTPEHWASLAHAVADHFVGILSEWLTAAELCEVRRRNAEEY